MLLFYVILFCLLREIHSLNCLSCKNVTTPAMCQTIVTCSTGHRCYTDAFGFGSGATFDLGCRTEQECLESGSASLIGRSTDGAHCSQCCAVDRCNEKLCAAGSQVINEVGVCSDDPNYNCQQISGIVNLCGDVVHAKTVCRKWCGLCDLVDGGWSLWTAWTNCDVTCGQGHVTRSRTCTDPAPAHGGLPCVGNKSETGTCNLDPCPVHGGWSSWGNWTSCSHTCGIGTQQRRRTCNNPVPTLFGDHCFGDAVDFRACFVRSCQVINEVGVCSDDPNYNCQQISGIVNLCGDVVHAKTVCRKWCGLCDLVDGGWSLWTAWTNCDVTCGQGHVTRSRTCTDPAPAHGGLPCVGNKSETGTCNLDPCPVHGGWSSWGNWTSCSHTCGIGTQQRRRTCNNPVPTLFGDHCFGDAVDFRACFVRSCQDGGWSLWTSWSSCASGRKTRTRVCDNPKPSQFGRDCSGSTEQRDDCGPVAFTVTSANGTIVNGHPLFTDIVTNVGGGYDPSTGVFTCPVAGLYVFSLSIVARWSYVYCYIGKNGADIAYARSDVASSSHYETASNSVYVQLSVNDTVCLMSCYNWGYADKDYGCSFSGSLIN